MARSHLYKNNATFFEGWPAPSVSMMTNTSPVGKAPVVGLLIASSGFAQLCQSAVCGVMMPINATFDQLRFALLLNTVIQAGLASLAY